jgi:hypothetical protein
MSYYNKTNPGRDHPNSWYIQRARCYERIIASQKPPTQKTVDRYGIQFDTQGRVIIPKDLDKPQIKVKIAPKVMKAQESIDWLLNNYRVKGELPKPDSVKKYKQLPSIIALAGGDNDNIVPTLENPKHLLKVLSEQYTNKNTLSQKWQVLLTHVDHVPMGLSKDLVGEYQQMFQNLKQNQAENTSDVRKAEKVYRWDKILEATDKLDPIGRFFFRMFDEIPIRTEFSHEIPVIHQVSDEPKEGNFVLDRGGHMVELHLREWKTKGPKYPDEIVYKFTPKLAELYRQRGVGNVLLPGISNWGKWVVESLDKVGFPNFPYGTPEFPLKDVASGLRKTLATFRNSTFNTKATKGAELAKLMLHDHSTSETVYRHQDFL